MRPLKNRRLEPRCLSRVEAADYVGVSPTFSIKWSLMGVCLRRSALTPDACGTAINSTRPLVCWRVMAATTHGMTPPNGVIWSGFG